MGNGSGPYRLNSRIYTNSFAGKLGTLAFQRGDTGPSFGGLSWKQYSYLTYHELADCGASFGSRGEKWLKQQNINPVFNPPRGF